MIQVEEKINKFKGKNILVVGLARSGTGAANLLASLGARVTVVDNKSREALQKHMQRLVPSVEVVAGGNPEELFETPDMIVVSPGVPLYIPPLQHARDRGIPVIGELELAYQAVSGETETRESAGYSPTSVAPAFIGVTGTNGKSTVTTLADIMIKESGFNSLLGGNIGIALTEELLNTEIEKTDYIVAEISSFQLESIHEFRPKIAAILNITPDHLDRYEGMDEYIKAKAKIFENQLSGDYLILNADDPAVMDLYNSKFRVTGADLPNVLFFSREKEVEGIYLRDGAICCNFYNCRFLAFDSEIIMAEEIRIKGIHNIENAMAASLIALTAGCSAEAVKKALKEFSGLEHRLEFVSEIKGVKFINDSKGTNVGAVAKSLEGFEKVHLIMGGTDKGSDFSVLKELIKNRVKQLILLGEAKAVIARSLEGEAETHTVMNLSEAVELSMSKALPGDVVMLSPGCASFDMFADFEDRGRKFKEAVREAGKGESR